MRIQRAFGNIRGNKVRFKSYKSKKRKSSKINSKKQSRIGKIELKKLNYKTKESKIRKKNSESKSFGIKELESKKVVTRKSKQEIQGKIETTKTVIYLKNFRRSFQ
jgi:hypothetical protein